MALNTTDKETKIPEQHGMDRTEGVLRSRVLTGVVIALIAVAGIVFGVVLRSGDGDDSSLSLGGSIPVYAAATDGHEPYPLVEADEQGVVRLPLETFDDQLAHYYTYLHGEQSIEFFVLMSDDGVIRAAFNACDVCFRSQKGYSQDGQIMVCNNCGSRFPADQINVVRGGCNPSPLERAIEDEHLVIRVDDILLGADYF